MIKQELEVGKHNVLFITLDSCRLDTAKNAKLPVLNGITNLRVGETQASYTLPAHLSFFAGILPTLIDDRGGYLEGVDQIWRSSSAKKRDTSVLIRFDAKTIIDFYSQKGYSVVGAGGVSFFSSSKNNILPKLFPRFLHFEKPQNMEGKKNIPRDKFQFPLANIESIVSELDNNKPYFLFINCPETHIPYDSPAVPVTHEYEKAVRHMYSLDFIKNRKFERADGLSQPERQMLMDAQKKSLEWIDSMIAKLIKKLPDNSFPTLLLVISDHGEEFGDNGRYGHAHVDRTVMTVPVWCTILPSR